jgi:hypothetical protein
MDIRKLINIIDDAEQEAMIAASEYESKHFAGGSCGACGFAWVILFEYDEKVIKGNTTMGRLLKRIGIEQNHERRFQVWNPSGVATQNVDTLEQGARAFAKVLNDNGFYAYVESRLD